MAVFAKFGYRVVLNAAFHVVRDKIRQPDNDSPPLFGIRVAQPDSNYRALTILTAPTNLAGGIAVQMGCHVVFLPAPGDLTFYDRVAHHTGHTATLRGHVVSWPIEPELLYDQAQRS